MRINGNVCCYLFLRFFVNLFGNISVEICKSLLPVSPAVRIKKKKKRQVGGMEADLRNLDVKKNKAPRARDESDTKDLNQAQSPMCPP